MLLTIGSWAYLKPQPASPEQVAEMERALDGLGGMLSERDFGYRLTGGLAIGLAARRLTRVHEDIDIQLPEASLASLATLLGRHGYRMMRFRFRRLFDKRVTIYRSADLSKDRGKLKAVKRNNGLLSYIDVYPEDSRGVSVCYKGFDMPSSGDGFYETRNGHRIPLMSPAYLKAIKEWRFSRKPIEKDAYDLAVLSALQA